MSSIFAHVCAAVVAKKLIRTDLPATKGKTLLALSISLALLPDIDVLIFIIFQYLPHRGVTHSLFFALIAAAAFTVFASRYLEVSKLKLSALFSISISSHLALDYLMGAGPPLPLFAPFSYKGFLSPIIFVPIAFYSKTTKGLFELLFYPPAIIGYFLEGLLFLPILLFIKKKNTVIMKLMLLLIFIFTLISTYQIYNGKLHL